LAGINLATSGLPFVFSCWKMFIVELSKLSRQIGLKIGQAVFLSKFL